MKMTTLPPEQSPSKGAAGFLIEMETQMKLNSLAAIKRRLTVGASLVMTRHDHYPDAKMLGVKRQIIKAQGNAVQFEGGSWLHFDSKPAGCFVGLTDNTFKVILCEYTDSAMYYEILEN